MTPAAIIRKLTVLAKEEARLLTSRNFKALSQSLSAKLPLAEQLSAAIIDDGGAVDRSIARDLDLLRAQSSENATRLAALRDSVARARVRIEGIIAAETAPGIYGAQGASLRARSAGGRSA